MAPRSSAAPSRLVLTEVGPTVDGGRHMVKQVDDAAVTDGATVFADGHDVLRCVVAHQPPGAKGWQTEVMTAVEPGLDRWEGTFVPHAEGIHRFKVLAWIDAWGSWR